MEKKYPIKLLNGNIESTVGEVKKKDWKSKNIQ